VGNKEEEEEDGAQVTSAHYARAAADVPRTDALSALMLHLTSSVLLSPCLSQMTYTGCLSCTSQPCCKQSRRGISRRPHDVGALRCRLRAHAHGTHSLLCCVQEDLVHDGWSRSADEALVLVHGPQSVHVQNEYC
jgi:hypothetical protein